MKLAIFCVCHNSYKEFFLFYKSIKKAEKNSKFKVSLFLLDNSSDKNNYFLDKINNLVKDDNAFQYISSPNYGYLGTIHKNLVKLNFKVSNFDYFCISNVDLLLKSDFFKVLEKCKFQNNIGMIGPSIITDKNIDKNPKIIHRPSIFKLLLNLLIFQFPFLSDIQFFLHHVRLKIYEKFFQKLKHKNVSDIIYTYSSHGSFLIFTKKGFSIISKENYPIFLFGEELFFGEQLRINNFYSIYKPSLVVFDKEHISTGKLSSKKYRNLNSKAISYIIKKFYLNNFFKKLSFSH